MKIDKKFKDEVDNTVREGGYVVRTVIWRIIAWVLVLSLIGGAYGLIRRYVRKNTDRVIFKQSITYNEGVLDDLAKYKYEYDTAEDDIEREAIASLVRNRFANYDKSKIENRDLVKFLKECGL